MSGHSAFILIQFRFIIASKQLNNNGKYIYNKMQVVLLFYLFNTRFQLKTYKQELCAFFDPILLLQLISWRNIQVHRKIKMSRKPINDRQNSLTQTASKRNHHQATNTQSTCDIQHHCIKEQKNNQYSHLLEYLFCTPTKSDNSSVISYNSSEFEIEKYPSPFSGIKLSASSVKVKRLKKIKYIQLGQCSICLQEITNQCKLQCNHRFCLQCVKQWFKNSNKCPYCRALVLYYWHDGDYYQVQVKQFKFESDTADNLDWACYNCSETQQGDIVLICDNCEAMACHVECDPDLHGREPEGLWYCRQCR